MKNGETRRGPLLLEKDRRVGDARKAADAGADQNASALLMLGVLRSKPESLMAWSAAAMRR